MARVSKMRSAVEELAGYPSTSLPRLPAEDQPLRELSQDEKRAAFMSIQRGIRWMSTGRKAEEQRLREATGVTVRKIRGVPRYFETESGAPVAVSDYETLYDDAMRSNTLTEAAVRRMELRIEAGAAPMEGESGDEAWLHEVLAEAERRVHAVSGLGRSHEAEPSQSWWCQEVGVTQAHAPPQPARGRAGEATPSGDVSPVSGHAPQAEAAPAAPFGASPPLVTQASEVSADDSDMEDDSSATPPSRGRSPAARTPESDTPVATSATPAARASHGSIAGTVTPVTAPMLTPLTSAVSRVAAPLEPVGEEDADTAADSAAEAAVAAAIASLRHSGALGALDHIAVGRLRSSVRAAVQSLVAQGAAAWRHQAEGPAPTVPASPNMFGGAVEEAMREEEAADEGASALLASAALATSPLPSTLKSQRESLQSTAVALRFGSPVTSISAAMSRLRVRSPSAAGWSSPAGSGTPPARATAPAAEEAGPSSLPAAGSPAEAASEFGVRWQPSAGASLQPPQLTPQKDSRAYVDCLHPEVLTPSTMGGLSGALGLTPVRSAGPGNWEGECSPGATWGEDSEFGCATPADDGVSYASPSGSPPCHESGDRRLSAASTVAVL